MANIMKSFERFAHEGVRKDLLQLKDSLSSNLSLAFGSSGEGELTINRNNVTNYARKFKQKDGWKVAVCHGAKTVNTVYPESNAEALEVIQKLLK